MKKNIRKVSVVLLIVMFSFSLLEGCGVKSEEQKPEVQESITYTEYTEPVSYSEDSTVSNASYYSTGKDENAITVTGGNISLSDICVERISSDSTGGDNSSFYGVGAAILASGGTTTIDNADISTDAAGGAGVFSYGDGIVKISNSNISTNQGTSGGIHVAGGGTLYATNVTAQTSGQSSAAIRSDRGGGLLVVDGGSFTSNGSGSPAIYCTANIAVKNAVLESTGSEAVCIEGLNSLYLYDCNLTGNMPEDKQNDCTWNVILYQSMSGDSKVGNSTFQMEGGTLTAQNGGMFYTTNTESTFILKNVTIIPAENAPFLLKCTGNANQRGWGSTGSNGADCTFTAIEQDLEGDILWDSVSNLTMYLTDSSDLKGAILQDESCAGNGGNGTATLHISKDSTWTVTDDSTLTAIYCEGKIVDDSGKTVTIQNTSGKVLVKGNSNLTVTVTTYETSADFSGADTITSYTDAQVNTGSKSTESTEIGDGGQPPEIPDGQGASGNGNQPPEQKGGDNPPEKP